MKLTRTRFLFIPLLVLSIVAMISSWTLLITCLVIFRKAGGYASVDDDPYYYKGEFYTLQEAYDNGYLTYEDLKEISKARARELEDERLKSSIQNTYYLKYLKDKKWHDGTLAYPGATINDVYVNEYYGTYSGCEIVQMADKFSDYPCWIHECVIEDIVIVYNGVEPDVWRKVN